MNSAQAQEQLWKRMPLSSSAFFYAGVFCLFGALLLTVSSPGFQSQSIGDIARTVVVAGFFSILWAYVAASRRFKLFAVLFPAQALAQYLMGRYGPVHHSLAGDLPALKHKFLVGAWVEFVLIVAAYILFLNFFRREGNRFFRTQTEVRLAGEIHGALVPQKHETIGRFEIFGSSVPSSEVGGDLFDIVQSNGTWHAYVADVSGHGVPAGMLMAMIKSAAAMQLTRAQRPDRLLADLNEILHPVTAPANYLTLAYVSGDTSGEIRFALAGHLPILHYQKQTRNILEHSDDNVPIGMFKDRSFTVSRMTMLPGDLLAIITDGFTEVFDSGGREMGMEDFKSALANCADQALPDIYRELRARTLKFGEQTDDQTMLLIRFGVPVPDAGVPG
jgi:serine phosphatase RsbU (regulator of sigma subunit)